MRPIAALLFPLALLPNTGPKPEGPPAPMNASTASMPAATPEPTNAPHILRLDPALDHLLSPDARPTVLASGFVFTEGPMWREDRFWFVDEEGDKVHAVTLTGEVSTLVDYTHGPYAKPPGTPTASPKGATTGPNAMATAPDGSVIAMQQYARDVVKLNENPQPRAAVPVLQTPYFDSFEGKHLNSPNDIVFIPDGSFFFSDPNYGLKGREHDPAKQLPYQAVFHVVDGKPQPVITDLQTPNGVAVSPDSKTLYVNNSGPDQRVIAYALRSDGSVGPARDVITFTGKEGDGVPDGLKVDSEGNLWTTGPGGIRIVTPEGKVLGQIKLPQTANNLAWGGSDGKVLLICAHDHIYQLKVRIPGSLPVFHR